MCPFIAYDDGQEKQRTLDGRPVAEINANLTSGLDVTVARPLPENAGLAFQGPVKVGPFDISGSVAEADVREPEPGRTLEPGRCASLGQRPRLDAAPTKHVDHRLPNMPIQRGGSI